MLTAEQKAKLPKKVQTELEVLEKNVEWWRGKYEGMLKSAETSRVVIPGLDERDIPLDERTRIQFNVGNTRYDYVEVYLLKSFEGYALSVRGGSGIAIHPSAGNAVEVTLK
jgi:hypothetical protein